MLKLFCFSGKFLFNILLIIFLNLVCFSLGLPSPPVEGLFSACALGILHKDSQLSELVLKELKPYENSPKHCHHIAFLTSQIYVQRNEPKKALLYLLSKVHRQPDLPLLRQVLANFLLINYNESQKYLKAASTVARSSIVLGIKNLKSLVSLINYF